MNWWWKNNGTKNLVPKRRFKEFQNASAWEQRKLGEVADIIGGGTPSTSNEKYWDGEIDWYSPVEIGEKIYVDSSQRKITELGLQKSSAKILPIGTVLFTSRAGIGNTAILAKEGATNQGFQSIVPHKDELDSYFIYSRSHELKHYGETNGAGSTFVEISGKQMAKMPMLIPALEEQKKIGSFFERLDHLIILQQHKLEKTKALKSAYLSEMFPAEGERVPKRRFAGFTQPWEQRKLGDVAEISAGGDIDKTKLSGFGKYPVIANALTNDGIIGYYENDFRIEAPAVTVTGRGDVGHAQARKTNFTPVVRLLSVKSKHDVDFLEHAINKHKVLVESTGVPQLTSPQLANYKIWFTSLEEEKKIGRFFCSLDNLITLHQRKLEKLQNLKKAYLNEMFV
ncbi:restriction endonuclease subunit S [Heyndrickxia coagulans]|nr:restriction endonuclease subunit S [Heyndrickxia coagulans]